MTGFDFTLEDENGQPLPGGRGSIGWAHWTAWNYAQQAGAERTLVMLGKRTTYHPGDPDPLEAIQ